MKQIAERVVAWHNRHLLARRISPAQVRSIGVVALPFARVGEEVPESPPTPDAAPGPAGRLAALRDRWGKLRLQLPLRRQSAAPVPADGLRAVFDEDFLGALPDGEARRWAEQHALPRRPGEDDWPQRDATVDARWATAPAIDPALADLIVDLSDRPGDSADAPGEAGQDADPPIRYALTAAIEVDGARRRLLLTSAAQPAILGRRALCPNRIALASALAAALAAALVLSPWLLRGKAAAAAAVGAPAASSAMALAASASAAASVAPAATAAPVPASTAASGSAMSTEALDAAPAAAELAASQGDAAAQRPAQAAASAAAPVTPASDPGSGPALPLNLRDAGRPGRPPASSHLPDGSKPTGSAAAQPTAGPVFALVSRSSLSRGEPQVALERMQAAAEALAQTLPGTHTELVQNGGRWSAIWWPFRSREEATQARWALALKGVTVEVVEF